MKKVLLLIVGLLAVAIGGGFLFLRFARPLVRPPSTEKIEATPERLARGEYLVRHVVDCLGCHSEFETEAYSLPPKPGTEGGGGFCFTKENVGFPGRVCAQNITPDKETGIGEWTDGEILRAIREGISRDGRALLPMMPYGLFRELSDEDAKAIVAYIRTLPALKKETPESQLDFPVSLFVRLEPKPLDGPVPHPNENDPVAYGKYLSNACYDCHTPVDDKMKTIPEKAWSGGRRFDIPGLSVVSANLTPDPTGLGERTEDQFVGQFKAFTYGTRIPVKFENNTLMPWHAFSGMEEKDLRAIYKYLRTVPKVSNTVDRRPPPSIPAAAAGAPAP